jgi:abhydrolase domain-containing protein 17
LIFSLLRIALLFYVALLVIGVFWSDRVIFRPRASSYRDGPEFVKLTAEDGKRITARYIANPSAKFTLLLSHGNAEDLGNDLAWHEELRSAGFSLFAYDYEGYGTSEGTPSEQRAYQDEIAAYSYLTSTLKAPPDRIIAFGKSVGTGPATYIAAREPVAGLILQSPFTSTFRLLTRIAILPFDKFPNYKNIRKVHCPVLIIHGTIDGVVPFWHGQEIYRLANEPKSHLWVDGANHNDVEMVAGDRYGEALRDFAAYLQVSRRAPETVFYPTNDRR